VEKQNIHSKQAIQTTEDIDMHPKQKNKANGRPQKKKRWAKTKGLANKKIEDEIVE